jgi:outer membrane protein assembly factor BamB
MLTRDLSDEWQAATAGFSGISTRGGIRHTIAINQQNAYAVTENRVWCHRLTTGSGRWSASLPAESTGSPLLFSDSVLVPTANGVTAYNQTTGVENWDVSTSDEVIGVAASPYGVVVITTGDSNQLRILSPENGDETHTFTIPDTPTAPSTVVDDIIYIPCENGVTAFSTTTKTVTWKYPTESAVEHPVTIADGYVVFHAGGTLRCLEQTPTDN